MFELYLDIWMLFSQPNFYALASAHAFSVHASSTDKNSIIFLSIENKIETLFTWNALVEVRKDSSDVSMMNFNL